MAECDAPSRADELDSATYDAADREAIEAALDRELIERERAMLTHCEAEDRRVEIRRVGSGRMLPEGFDTTVWPVMDDIPVRTKMAPDVERRYADLYYERTGRYSVVRSRAAVRELGHRGLHVQNGKPVPLREALRVMGWQQTGPGSWAAPPPRERWEVKDRHGWRPASPGEITQVLRLAAPRARERGGRPQPTRTRGSRRTSTSRSRAGPSGDEPGEGEADGESDAVGRHQEPCERRRPLELRYTGRAWATRRLHALEGAA